MYIINIIRVYIHTLYCIKSIRIWPRNLRESQLVILDVCTYNSFSPVFVECVISVYILVCTQIITTHKMCVKIQVRTCVHCNMYGLL